MNRDGDILGMRRRLESASGEAGVVTGSSSSFSGIRQLSAIAGSPLKRQRAADGVFARGPPEEILVGCRAGVVPVDKLTPDQLKRYRAWKRSRIERSCIKELILDRASPTLTRAMEAGHGSGTLRETTTIAVAAVTKMFVGDVIEEGAGLAKLVQFKRGEGGPLQPKDLLEARERLAKRGLGPPTQPSSASRERAGGGVGIEKLGVARLLGGSARLVEGDTI